MDDDDSDDDGGGDGNDDYNEQLPCLEDCYGLNTAVSLDLIVKPLLNRLFSTVTNTIKKKQLKGSRFVNHTV